MTNFKTNWERYNGKKLKIEIKYKKKIQNRKLMTINVRRSNNQGWLRSCKSKSCIITWNCIHLCVCYNL